MTDVFCYSKTMDKVKNELINYLKGAHTHKSLADAVADFPPEYINRKPENSAYSFWDLLYHINFTQHDMIDFVCNPGYQEVAWPKDYWPKAGEMGDEQKWKHQIEQYHQDLETFINVIKDPKTDLTGRIPYGSGQTILKEVMQVVDHASYHIGEFILMRKLMQIWD